MEFIKAANQFIENYYQKVDLDRIESIEIGIRDSEKYSRYFLEIQKQSENFDYDFFNFDNIDYYEVDESVHFKQIINLENSSYVFWKDY
ncbi:hypothetical protein SK637_00979 [Streptococcus mitis]|uniref:hypothetical protein n=1 Tax=Streptococcus mitis TaxID=28037 RepID=UPI0004D4C45B|nr:hypothetical protein [Streptococcus mitis]QBZ13508.1 hypothetical protein SK637_00979 [Streptococcus mitis]